jgi:hypothetical protein
MQDSHLPVVVRRGLRRAGSVGIQTDGFDCSWLLHLNRVAGYGFWEHPCLIAARLGTRIADDAVGAVQRAQAPARAGNTGFRATLPPRDERGGGEQY